MSKLKIKGKLQYIPGPWGLHEPVKGAKVKIIDKDPGGVDDVILTRTTNSLGKFSGTSKDWQDTKRIRYWDPLSLSWKTKTVPDPTDIMLLELDIKHGSNHFRGPFVFLGNNVEVPVVVPWGKSDFALTTYEVNGTPCTDGQDLQKKARAAFESGVSRVTITIRGPESIPFLPLAGKNLSQLKELVDDILPGAKDMLYPNPCEAACLTAIAFLILAVGAATAISVVASAIAVSLVLGTVLGYCIVEVKEELSGSPTSADTGISFKLEKC